ARWYCPEGHRTFSLLPDFLAARLPDLLDSIEESVTVAQSAKSLEVAANLLPGPTLPCPEPSVGCAVGSERSDRPSPPSPASHRTHRSVPTLTKATYCADFVAHCR